MDRQWLWRLTVATGLVVLSVLMLTPTLVGVAGEGEEEPLPEWFTKIFNQRLILGLDLQGGIHLQYKVDIEDALRRKSNQVAGTIVYEMEKDKGVKGVKAEAGKGADLDEITTITLTFPQVEDMVKLDERFLRINAPDFIVQSDDEETKTIVLGMRTEHIDQFRSDSLDQAMETIERRINEFGVAESTISRRGESELVVQLPGVREKEFGQAKEKLSQTGQLHFQIVDRENISAFFDKIKGRKPDVKAWPKGLDEDLKIHTVYVSSNTIRSTSREILEYMAEGQVEDDHLVGFEEIFVNPKDPTLSTIDNLSKDQEKLLRKSKAFDPEAAVVKGYQLHYLFRQHGMSGENVEDASVGFDSFNRPVVHMRFNQVDANKFYEMTKQFTKELMAIMIDEMVYSAPRIKEPIGGGRVQIELGSVGPQAQKEATALVAVLKSGALQAPLRKLYDSQVGPTLGSDSVEAGKLSVALGMIFVIIFMLIYYKGAGFIANIALLLNLVLMLAGLTAFGATLTLPGIAGIVLTVGMAVDANVLIFERIREELRTGVGVRKAIDAGYEKAFSAIFDANITTGIAAVVLYQFGSGPIRGFAVTLGIGIVCSMYTALVITRLIFDRMYGRGKEPAKMSI
ncbi:protein translocase subunit SecD [Myxococcota bacterium]|nr:protein translocase subunit SecD [Myxococcota bacterium]